VKTLPPEAIETPLPLLMPIVPYANVEPLACVPYHVVYTESQVSEIVAQSLTKEELVGIQHSYFQFGKNLSVVVAGLLEKGGPGGQVWRDEILGNRCVFLRVSFEAGRIKRSGDGLPDSVLSRKEFSQQPIRQRRP